MADPGALQPNALPPLKPLGHQRPLGTYGLAVRFMRPLGARPLTVLDPNLFTPEMFAQWQALAFGEIPDVLAQEARYGRQTEQRRQGNRDIKGMGVSESPAAQIVQSPIAPHQTLQPQITLPEMAAPSETGPSQSAQSLPSQASPTAQSQFQPSPGIQPLIPSSQAAQRPSVQPSLSKMPSESLPPVTQADDGPLQDLGQTSPSLPSAKSTQYFERTPSSSQPYFERTPSPAEQVVPQGETLESQSAPIMPTDEPESPAHFEPGPSLPNRPANWPTPSRQHPPEPVHQDSPNLPPSTAAPAQSPSSTPGETRVPKAEPSIKPMLEGHTPQKSQDQPPPAQPTNPSGAGAGMRSLIQQYFSVGNDEALPKRTSDITPINPLPTEAGAPSLGDSQSASQTQPAPSARAPEPPKDSSASTLSPSGEAIIPNPTVSLNPESTAHTQAPSQPLASSDIPQSSIAPSPSAQVPPTQVNTPSRLSEAASPLPTDKVEAEQTDPLGRSPQVPNQPAASQIPQAQSSQTVSDQPSSQIPQAQSSQTVSDQPSSQIPQAQSSQTVSDQLAAPQTSQTQSSQTVSDQLAAPQTSQTQLPQTVSDQLAAPQTPQSVGDQLSRSPHDQPQDPTQRPQVQPSQTQSSPPLPFNPLATAAETPRVQQADDRGVTQVSASASLELSGGLSGTPQGQPESEFTGNPEAPKAQSAPPHLSEAGRPQTEVESTGSPDGSSELPPTPSASVPRRETVQNRSEAENSANLLENPSASVERAEDAQSQSASPKRLEAVQIPVEPVNSPNSATTQPSRVNPEVPSSASMTPPNPSRLSAASEPIGSPASRMQPESAATRKPESLAEQSPTPVSQSQPSSKSAISPHPPSNQSVSSARDQDKASGNPLNDGPANQTQAIAQHPNQSPRSEVQSTNPPTGLFGKAVNQLRQWFSPTAKDNSQSSAQIPAVPQNPSNVQGGKADLPNQSPSPTSQSLTSERETETGGRTASPHQPVNQPARAVTHPGSPTVESSETKALNPSEKSLDAQGNPPDVEPTAAATELPDLAQTTASPPVSAPPTPVQRGEIGSQGANDDRQPIHSQLSSEEELQSFSPLDPTWQVEASTVLAPQPEPDLTGWGMAMPKVETPGESDDVVPSGSEQPTSQQPTRLQPTRLQPTRLEPDLAPTQDAASAHIKVASDDVRRSQSHLSPLPSSDLIAEASPTPSDSTAAAAASTAEVPPIIDPAQPPSSSPGTSQSDQSSPGSIAQSVERPNMTQTVVDQPTDTAEQSTAQPRPEVTPLPSQRVADATQPILPPPPQGVAEQSPALPQPESQQGQPSNEDVDTATLSDSTTPLDSSPREGSLGQRRSEAVAGEIVPPAIALPSQPDPAEPAIAPPSSSLPTHERLTDTALSEPAQPQTVTPQASATPETNLSGVTPSTSADQTQDQSSQSPLNRDEVNLADEPTESQGVSQGQSLNPTRQSSSLPPPPPLDSTSISIPDGMSPSPVDNIADADSPSQPPSVQIGTNAAALPQHQPRTAEHQNQPASVAPQPEQTLTPPEPEPYQPTSAAPTPPDATIAPQAKSGPLGDKPSPSSPQFPESVQTPLESSTSQVESAPAPLETVTRQSETIPDQSESVTPQNPSSSIQPAVTARQDAWVEVQPGGVDSQPPAAQTPAEPIGPQVQATVHAEQATAQREFAQPQPQLRDARDELGDRSTQAIASGDPPPDEGESSIVQTPQPIQPQPRASDIEDVPVQSAARLDAVESRQILEPRRDSDQSATAEQSATPAPITAAEAPPLAPKSTPESVSAPAHPPNPPTAPQNLHRPVKPAADYAASQPSRPESRLAPPNRSNAAELADTDPTLSHLAAHPDETAAASSASSASSAKNLTPNTQPAQLAPLPVEPDSPPAAYSDSRIEGKPVPPQSSQSPSLGSAGPSATAEENARPRSPHPTELSLGTQGQFPRVLKPLGILKSLSHPTTVSMPTSLASNLGSASPTQSTQSLASQDSTRLPDTYSQSVHTQDALNAPDSRAFETQSLPIAKDHGTAPKTSQTPPHLREQTPSMGTALNQWNSLAELAERVQANSNRLTSDSLDTTGPENSDTRQTAQDSSTTFNTVSTPSPMPQQWHNLADFVQQATRQRGASNPEGTSGLAPDASPATALTQADVRQSGHHPKSQNKIFQNKTTSSDIAPPKSSAQPKAKAEQSRRPLSKPTSSKRGTLKLPTRPTPKPIIQAKFEPTAQKPGRDKLIQAKPEDPDIQLKSDENIAATEPDARTVELLAQEVYGLLRQRLAIEQERHGSRGHIGRFL